jgi:hypothetical protein
MNQFIWSAGSPLYKNCAHFENGLKHDSRQNGTKQKKVKINHPYQVLINP